MDVGYINVIDKTVQTCSACDMNIEADKYREILWSRLETTGAIYF